MNHMEFAAAESAALEPSAWDRWVNAAEKLLGHDLDGSQEENGYSLDFSYEDWKRGMSVTAYVAKVKGQTNYAMRRYANGTGFSGR